MSCRWVIFRSCSQERGLCVPLHMLHDLLDLGAFRSTQLFPEMNGVTQHT